MYGDGLFSASKRRSVWLEATGAPPPPTLPPFRPSTRDGRVAVMSVDAMAVRWLPPYGDAVHTALSQFAVIVITEGASHTDPLPAAGIAYIWAYLL